MAAAVFAVAAVCAVLSALWPVEYASAGLDTVHPVQDRAPEAVSVVWSALAHPAYVAFQVLWVLVVVARWRTSDGHVRQQLAWLLIAVGCSALALVLGLVAWQTPRPGILSATVIPLAAGWAVVHGQHLASYWALSWLSRTEVAPEALLDEFARAVGQALDAPGATLWLGTADHLAAVGVWPETGQRVDATDLTTLGADSGRHVRPVLREGAVVGALDVERNDLLTLAQARLLDDLSAQASLVIAHQSLADVIARQRQAGQLDGLTPREREVLELLARGLSNAAICQQLHLSIKTVEPVVSSIFIKLGLRPDGGSNRRVLAALAYLRG